MRVLGWVVTCAAALGGASGCQPGSRLVERDEADAPMFAPTEIRVHPFTSVKDWDADGRTDGLEALIELQDRFRDPTKATGTVLFELYTYRRNYPDPRGERLAAWRGSLLTLEEQRMHWNRISRTYSFQLSQPEARADRSYVLQVWFEHAGRRLTSQVVLEGQEAEAEEAKSRGADDGGAKRSPTTRPASGPGSSTRPGFGG
jgi:hypothetical protein